MSQDREDMKADVSRALDAALERLHKIWEEIGIVEDQRRDRMNVVVVHLRNLLDEMVNEENRMKEKIMKKVRLFQEQLENLTRELKLPEYQPPAGLSVLRLEKNLQAQVETLSTDKNERVQKLKQLRQKDQHLCDMLCATPYYIPSGCVPTKEQLQELQDHIANLIKEEERRRHIFRNTKASIAKYMDDLEKGPNTSFERDVLCDEQDTFVLNNGNLKQLKDWHDGLERKSNDNYALANTMRSRIKTLWERLETPEDEREEFFTKYTGYKPSVITAMKEESARLERLKHENLQKVLDGARGDLQHWWDKCFISENERFKFRAFYEPICTEESLESHDREVNRYKLYYETNREMIENVSKWQSLFTKFLQFEKKTTDPSRLLNRGRGGALIKEQKERKRYESLLPKVEAEVKEQIELWETTQHRQFLVDGVRFVDYIQNQWEDYNRNKENEKDQRHRAKAQEMEHEVMFGSKPATTPNKRRLYPATTPNGKTPNKRTRTDGEEACDTKLSDGAQSTFSSTASSTDHGRGNVKCTHPFKPPPGIVVIKSAKKLNDTPGSVSRMGRTYQTNTMCSPQVMPPRSAAKLDDVAENTTKTPRPGLPTRPDQTPARGTGESRHVMKDTYMRSTLAPPTTSNETVFSQTTIASCNTLSSSATAPTGGDSVASVGPYNEFARKLNEKSRDNHRSSVLPPATKPAVFF